MKSTFCLTLSWIRRVFRQRWGIALVTLLPLVAQAQSTLLITEPPTDHGDKGIDGLDLYSRGFYWWKRGREGGEFSSYSRLGVVYALPSVWTFLSKAFPLKLNHGNPNLDGAALDGGWMYFTRATQGAPGLFRKPVTTADSDGIEVVHAAAAEGLAGVGALAIHDGYVYYAPHYNGGAMGVVRVPVNALGKIGTPEQKTYTVVPGTAGVRKILFYRASGNTWGLVLTRGGTLFKFGPLESPGRVASTIIAQGVGEVFIRPEPSGLLQVMRDRIYATTDQVTSPGRLFTLNPDTLVQDNVYKAPAGDSPTFVESAAADANYLFVSIATDQSLQPQTPGQILRNYSPADPSTQIPSEDAGVWKAVEAGRAAMMRSDGDWLYFAREHEVRRISTTAPSIALDVGVFGLEVVQVSQNFGNSVPLVADKPAVARGYVWMTANSANGTKPIRHPHATLYVYQDGKLVDEIAPYHYPDVRLQTGDTAALLATYRGNAALDYLFEIPARLIQPGTMRFEMKVNERRTLVEVGSANVWNNNQISIPFMRVEARVRPTLIFTSVDNAGAPPYTLSTDPKGFKSVLDRAIQLLPISGFSLRVNPQILHREQFVYWPLPPHYEDRSWTLTGLTDPNDQSNDALAALDTISIQSSFDDPHLIGMVHPNVPTFDAQGSIFNGLGDIQGRGALVRMSTETNIAVWQNTRGGIALAHELGHNYGRSHVLQATNCGKNLPLNPDPSYPYPGCQFGPSPSDGSNAVFGYDLLNDIAIDGTLVGDLMSYAAFRWPSDYTYVSVFNAIPSPSAPPPPGPVLAQGPLDGNILLLGGLANLSKGTVQLQPAQNVPVQIYNAKKILRSLADATSAQGHGLMIQQLNAQGGVIAESNLILTQTGDDGDNAPRSFVQFVQPASDVAEVRITQGTATLASLRVSSSAPTVFVQDPVVDTDAGLLRWSWSAADADGDPLVFTVQYSKDDGNQWETVSLNTLANSVALDLNSLPGGARAQLRVIASDGFNATVEQSQLFTVPRHSPTITLSGLAANAQVEFGKRINLSALAFDLDDGSLLPESVSWSLAGPESTTTTGLSLRLEDLPPGHYHLEVRAVDSDGDEGKVERDFDVLPFSIPELVEVPILDGVPDETVWSSALVVRWHDYLGKPVSARVFRSGGYVYASFNDLAFGVGHRIGGGNYLPAQVGLYLDAGGTGGDKPSGGVAGFFVDENGVPTQKQGDGSTLVDRVTPNSTFQAVVNNAEFGWSVEMRIGTGLVGDAGQALRLALSTTVPDAVGTHPTWWPSAATPGVPDSWVPGFAAGTPPASTNLPPSACAGGNQVLEAVGTKTVSLVGTCSTDPEGAPLAYQWTQLAGPTVDLKNATSPTAVFTVTPSDVEQSWVFALTVSDGEFATTSDPVTIRLLPLPVLPPSQVSTAGVTPFPDGSLEGRIPAGGSVDGGTPPSPGQRYRIESSVDLDLWTPLSESSPDFLGQLVFRDLANGEPHKFYRALPIGPVQNLQPGQLLDFHSGGGMVQIGSRTAGSTFPLSVSAWIRTDHTAADAGGIVSKYSDATAVGWSVLVYEGHLRAWYIRNYGVNQVHEAPLGIDGGFVADGAWHHIVFVVDTHGGTLYVDGSATGVMRWTGTPGRILSAVPIQIGRYQNNANSFAGQIDEVTLWSSGLNAFEVQALERRGPSGAESNLEGWWKFDEGEGETAQDSSSKGRDGTLIQGPVWGTSDAPIQR